MNILLAVYLLVAAVFLLVLAFLSWRRRHVPALREFTLFCVSVALLMASYALELTLHRLESLKLALHLEWCSAPFVPYFWLMFSLVWCGYGHLANRVVRLVLLLLPIVTLLLAQTSDYHTLLYTSLWVDTSGSFPMLAAQNGPWYWVDFAYMNFCIVTANILFIRQFRNARPLHRRQAQIMMLASFIPWIVHVGFNLEFGNGVYITPFGLSITAMLFAWGIFRQQLLDTTPVARHELVELMRDPVLVFNDAGRLLDHNRAACQLLCEGKGHGDEITRAEIVRRAPDLAEALERVERGESCTFRQSRRVFSLSATVLSPAAGEKLTLCMLHDITEQSRAEESLRLLNATLEERVAREVAQNRAKDQVLARQARIAAMGEMVGAIAHQWRQPLAILAIIVQDFYAAAKQGGAPSRTAWDEFKSDALEQIRHMSRTIDEFRNFLRPDHGQERFPVVQCMEEAVRRGQCWETSGSHSASG